MLNKIISVVFIFILSTTALSAKNITLFGTHSQSYQFAQLQNALSYSLEKNYLLFSFKGEIPKQRAFNLMNHKEEVDVIFGGATIERENKGLPIRIPILKGLNGWRLPLINKNQKELFLSIDSMAKFRKLIPGQYYSWSDTKVLESNDINVAKGSDYEGLFHMLDRGRIDYFPLSVLEIFDEFEPRKHLNIIIDVNTLIHYPTAYYFYVGKNNQMLANDISVGLEKAIADGSFDDIFLKYHGDVINGILNIKRKVFSLDNPFLSDKTPLSRKKLWINLHPESN
jgi:hypothetical protein